MRGLASQSLLPGERHDVELYPVEGLGESGGGRVANGEAFAVSIGGTAKPVTHAGPVYSAIFEVDSPEVLVSPQWARAVEAGRWPKEVRPYTRNRQHALFKVR